MLIIKCILLAILQLLDYGLTYYALTHHGNVVHEMNPIGQLFIAHIGTWALIIPKLFGMLIYFSCIYLMVIRNKAHWADMTILIACVVYSLVVGWSVALLVLLPGST